VQTLCRTGLLQTRLSARTKDKQLSLSITTRAFRRRILWERGVFDNQFHFRLDLLRLRGNVNLIEEEFQLREIPQSFASYLEPRVARFYQTLGRTIKLM